MKPTTKELSKQIALLKKEGKRRALAVKAGVCPECGAKLVQVMTRKILYEGYRWLFWTVKPTYYFSYSNTCSVDPSHYKAYTEPKRDYDSYGEFDDDEDGSY